MEVEGLLYLSYFLRGLSSVLKWKLALFLSVTVFHCAGENPSSVEWDPEDTLDRAIAFLPCSIFKTLFISVVTT